MTYTTYMTYKIIILGPQGSGKGTQGKMISEKFNIPLISTGALLRKEIADKTGIGKQIEDLLKQGRLAPDDLVTKLLRRRLNEPDARKGFILDGYPRNRAQSDLLEDFMKPTHILALRLADHEALKRMSGRLLCPQCGSNYHTVYNPPKHDHGTGEWFCDQDETLLIIRDDDKPEAIQQRLDVYHQETESLFELYQPAGLVHDIDASKSIEEIQQEILKVLEK